MVLPCAKLATGNAGVQAPTVTGTLAPVLSIAVAVHVGFRLVPTNEVHVTVPFTVLPGLLTVGKPLKATVMSAVTAVTVKVAVSHAGRAGATAGAHTW